MGLKINLGCGLQYLPGYVNCDCLEHVRADKHFDLNLFPYPFEASSADEIFMDNVLEHLDDIPKVMAELHRVLRPGGKLQIIVPYAKTDWAFQDPTHKHYFTERSMDYFAVEGPWAFYSVAKFRIDRAELVGHSTTWLHKLRNLIPMKRVLRYFLFNLYDNVRFELTKVEDNGALNQPATKSLPPSGAIPS